MTDYKHSHPCEPQIAVSIVVVFLVTIIAMLGVISNINNEHKQEIVQIKSTCGDQK